MYFSCISFFTTTAPTEIYTLSLHDALPISRARRAGGQRPSLNCYLDTVTRFNSSDVDRSDDLLKCRYEPAFLIFRSRSEEHTSELQSQSNLVCRLLLEKKNTDNSCSASRSQ